MVANGDAAGYECQPLLGTDLSSFCGHSVFVHLLNESALRHFSPKLAAPEELALQLELFVYMRSGSFLAVNSAVVCYVVSGSAMSLELGS